MALIQPNSKHSAQAKAIQTDPKQPELIQTNSNKFIDTNQTESKTNLIIIDQPLKINDMYLHNFTKSSRHLVDLIRKNHMGGQLQHNSL